MSDRRKVRQTSVCRITPPNAVGDKLKFVGHQATNFQEGAGMLEAEATADMLLMTQPFKAPSVSAPEIVEEPVAAQLVKAVLAGQRERFSAGERQTQSGATKNAGSATAQYHSQSTQDRM